MKANIRSICGATLMLVIIPMIAGLLACIPGHVPLGDPGKARINPEMSGIWYAGNSDEWIGVVVVLQPWDKRTWLITNVIVELHEEEIAEAADVGSYDGLVAWIRTRLGKDHDAALGAMTFKGWIWKLGGELFFVWESRGVLNGERKGGEGILEPWFAWDFRIVSFSGDTLELNLINDQSPLFEGVARTRRDWERVVRKHADNPELYEERAASYRRVDPEHEDLFADLVNEILLGDL
jgi:hypothetical protein